MTETNLEMGYKMLICPKCSKPFAATGRKGRPHKFCPDCRVVSKAKSKVVTCIKCSQQFEEVFKPGRPHQLCINCRRLPLATVIPLFRGEAIKNGQ